MARSAKVPAAKKSTTPGRKPGRPASAAAKASAKAPAVASKRPAAASPAATPKPSKDELRALVEKLEAGNATLRTKNRDANRAAKIAAARIAELEDQVAQLEKRAAPPPPASAKKSSAKPVAPVRGKRQRRAVDPGDAAPSGVAVEEIEPDETETTSENQEETLHAE